MILLIAASVAGCSQRPPSSLERALEPVLLARAAGGRPGLAPVTFDRPIHALPPGIPPLRTFPLVDWPQGEHWSPVESAGEAVLLRGIYMESRRIVQELPEPCRRGVLRWRMRPDRMDHSASVALGLMTHEDSEDVNAASLAIHLGRTGGGGKRQFRIHGAGNWLARAPLAAAVLEGVELDVCCAWDLTAGTFALSVADGFHRTLLDETLPLKTFNGAEIARFTLSLNGLDNYRGDDPRLDLVLWPFEFWNLDPLP